MIKKTFRIILNNIFAMLSLRKYISIVFVFTIIHFITVSLYDISNFNDVFRFSFYGVNNIADMPIEFLKIILCNMFLVYLNLSFGNEEIKTRSSILVIRIGSKKLWVNSLIVSILILCFIYYLIGFVILGAINYIYFSIHANFLELINIFWLMCLSGFLICLVSLLISIFVDNEMIIFAITLSLFFLSIGLGSAVTYLDKYTIFTQGMLIKHEAIIPSFQWSYCYLGIVCLLLCVIVKIKLVEKDFY